MAVTDVGMDTEVRFLQSAKAQSPMIFTEVGMETEVRELQHLKS